MTVGVDTNNSPDGCEPTALSPVPPASGKPLDPLSSSTPFFSGTTRLNLTPDNLSEDRNLRGAPRITYGTHTCPQLGGYVLLKYLGGGAMGHVYRAIHTRLNTEYAVKVLAEHLVAQNPTFVKRFVREAQIAVNARSPHLVAVYDVNEERGIFYLAMELVNGSPCDKLVADAIRGTGQALSESDALKICIAATEGLRAAHDAGIIHRDIKPGNIMVPFDASSQLSGFDAAKLMDLGLARPERTGQSTPDFTETATTMGTPGFMAPEQALDARRADRRSDIFSMGATLYALLTGQGPFKGESPVATIYASIGQPHVPLHSLRPDVSPWISRAVDRALAKDPVQRQQDAVELLKELRYCLASMNSGSVSPPTSLTASLKSQTQATLVPTKLTDVKPRRAPFFTAVAAAGILLVGGSSYVAYSLLRNQTHADVQNADELRGTHRVYLDQAVKAAEEGDLYTTNVMMRSAARVPLNESQLRDAEMETETKILAINATRQKKFDELKTAFDTALENQDAPKARKLLDEMRLAAGKQKGALAEVVQRDLRAQELTLLKDREEEFVQTLRFVETYPPARALVVLKDAAALLESNELQRSKKKNDFADAYKSLRDRRTADKAREDQELQTRVKEERLTAALKKVDALFASRSTLRDVDSQIQALSAEFAGEERIGALRTRLETLQSNYMQMDRLLSDATEDLAANKVNDAKSKLDSAEKLNIPDTRVADLRMQWSKKSAELGAQDAAVKEVLQRLNIFLDKDDLKSATETLAMSEPIFPNNPQLAAGRKQLDERKDALATADKNFASIDQLMLNNGAISDIEKLLNDTTSRVKDRSKLAAYQQRISAYAVELARKNRVAPILEAADRALADGNIEEAGTQIRNAREKGALTIELESLTGRLEGARNAAAAKSRELERANAATARAVAIKDYLANDNLDNAKKELDRAKLEFTKDTRWADLETQAEKRTNFLAAIAKAQNSFRSNDLKGANTARAAAAALFAKDEKLDALDLLMKPQVKSEKPLRKTRRIPVPGEYRPDDDE